MSGRCGPTGCCRKGTLKLPPDFFLTDSGEMAPVLHRRHRPPLYDDTDGSSSLTSCGASTTSRPDFAACRAVRPVCGRPAARRDRRRPVRPSEPRLVVGNEFARMWEARARPTATSARRKNVALGRSPPLARLLHAGQLPGFDVFSENAIHRRLESRLQDDRRGRARRPGAGRGKNRARAVRFGRYAAGRLHRSATRHTRGAEGRLHPVNTSVCPWM